MNMKKQLVIVLLLISFIIVGCASGGPKLGTITLIQREINALPAVPVAGNNLKFQFGGETWIATNNGVNFIAGTLTTETTTEGLILSLKQTHLYSTQQKPGIGGDVGWVKTPGPEITLLHTSSGGRNTLTVR
ncbi:MAG: hypothetical protein FWG98_15825 [Candidatus Cloacimonetes bacterium]|nr:hypothetical protein [Candidatus Cloacimonadota bacterium]